MTSSSVRTRTPVRLLLVVMFAVTCQLLPAGAATSAITRGVRGVVSGPDGPLVGATVRVSPLNGGFWNSTMTGADGSYSVELPEGRYEVCFDAPGLATECWNNSLPTLPGYTPVFVTPENPVVDVSPTMGPGITLTGRLLTEDGQPVQGWVQAEAGGFRWGGAHSVTFTPSNVAADGSFEVHLLPGTWQVSFGSGYDYAVEYFKNAYTRANATPVTGDDGTTVIVGDVVLLRPMERLRVVDVIQAIGDVGQTLTVDPSRWNPVDFTVTRQWLRSRTDDFAVAESIAGATGATYTPSASEDGWYVGVVETATAPGHAPAESFDFAWITAAKPVIIGSARVGNVLQSTNGPISPYQMTITRQWFRGTTPIAGATSASYQVQPADVAQRLRVRVTGTWSQTWNPAPPVVRESAASAPAIGYFVVRKYGWIAGILRKGYTLTAYRPLVHPAPAKVRYQWLRNGTPIRGAVYQRYRLTRYDRGKKIAVRVIQIRPYYTNITHKLERNGYVR